MIANYDSVRNGLNIPLSLAFSIYSIRKSSLVIKQWQQCQQIIGWASLDNWRIKEKNEVQFSI